MPETNPAEVIIGVDTHKHAHAAVALTTLGGTPRDNHDPGKPQRLSGAGDLGTVLWTRAGLWGRGQWLLWRGPLALPPGQRPHRHRGEPPQPPAAIPTWQERSARCRGGRPRGAERPG